MEAVWNRVEDNFNNNGATFAEQLLAPKQFTGLFLFYPHQFRWDKDDPILEENLQIARSIIQGIRRCPSRIYYWASKSVDSNTSHYNWMKSQSYVDDSSFKQIFL